MLTQPSMCISRVYLYGFVTVELETTREYLETTKLLSLLDYNQYYQQKEPIYRSSFISTTNETIFIPPRPSSKPIPQTPSDLPHPKHSILTLAYPHLPHPRYLYTASNFPHLYHLPSLTKLPLNPNPHPCITPS